MKQLSILLAMCMVIFATSCNDDEEKLETYISFYQNYTVTDTEGNANIFPETIFYYEIDLIEGEVDITLNNVKFSPKMSDEITMEINDIRISASNSGGYKFKGSNIVPEVNDEDVPAYTITSISGEIFPLNNANGFGCSLTFVVNNQYTVNAYSSPMLFERNSSTIVQQTIYSDNIFAFDNAYFVVSIDEVKSTAQIQLYNIKFAEKMHMALNLSFNDIPVTVTSNGIELSCESFIPAMNNKEQTPMNNYPITNLKGVISKDCLQLDFNCTITAEGSSVEGQSYMVKNTAHLIPQDKAN